MKTERIDVKKTIARAINDGLEKKKMNKKQLAEMIPISAESVTKWTTGQSLPTNDNIVRINEILDLNLFELLHEEERRIKRNMIINNQTKDIKDLDTFEKASTECKNILTITGADKYSHAIFIMLEWLVTASIGLTYHWYLHKKRKEDETIYEDIFFYLNNIIEEHGNDADRDFFDMDMDLLESSVPLVGDVPGETINQYFPNYEYAQQCVWLWYKFKNAYDYDEQSDFNREFKVALLDVISKNSCY